MNHEIATVPKFVGLLLLVLFAQPAPGQTTQTAEGYLNRGIALLQKGDASGALTDLTRAIELNPKLADAFALRAEIRSRRGDLEGAIADYDKVIELIPNAVGMEAVYTNRSMLRLQKGDVDGASADLDKAISINPRVAEIYNGRAIIRLQKGDLNGALADYEKVIELKPTMPSAFMGRGIFRYKKGDLDGALADFNKAIDLKADYADTYVDRGCVNGLKGDIDHAIADISKGASLNPKSISDASRGRFTSPFDDLTTFLKAHPTNARAYEVRGILRLFQGHADLAEADFERSLTLEPKLGQEIDDVKRKLSGVFERSRANKS